MILLKSSFKYLATRSLLFKQQNSKEFIKIQLPSASFSVRKINKIYGTTTTAKRWTINTEAWLIYGKNH